MTPINPEELESLLAEIESLAEKVLSQAKNKASDKSRCKGHLEVTRMLRQRFDLKEPQSEFFESGVNNSRESVSQMAVAETESRGKGYKINKIQTKILEDISRILTEHGYSSKQVGDSSVALDAPDSILAIQVYMDGSTEIVTKKNVFGKVLYTSMKKPFTASPGKHETCTKRMIGIHEYHRTQKEIDQISKSY